MDRGAWWATVHNVAKSQTQLSMHTRAYTQPYTGCNYSTFMTKDALMNYIFFLITGNSKIINNLIPSPQNSQYYAKKIYNS